MTSLNEYYRNYYNGKHFRHVTHRLLVANGSKTYDLKYNPDSDRNPPYEKFRKTLINPKYRKDGDLMAGISHYPNYATYTNGNKYDMLTSRLFFDFDMDPDKCKDTTAAEKMRKAKGIVKSMRDAYGKYTGKELTAVVSKKQKDFRNLIFNKDLLRPVYDETMRFIHELEDGMNLKVYLTLSGSSGFHVNLFMPDQKLPYIEYTRKELHRIFRDKLYLNYQDDNVLDALTRKQRVPYSINPKSNLLVRPIPSDISYDDLLQLIKNNKYTVDDFSMEDYYVTDEFIDMLHYFDNRGKSIAIKKKEEAELWQQKHKNKSNINSGKIFKGQINITKPEDAIKLLSFQCFNQMEYDDYYNLLLVNLLWNTGLPDAESVQKAMIYFWQQKGHDMKLSKSGLKRVAANSQGKYAPTNNTMKKNQLCSECKDWKQCFRYKLYLKPEYKERIQAYKNIHA